MTHIPSDAMFTKALITFVNQACPFITDVSRCSLRVRSVANLAEGDLSKEAGRPAECVSMEMEEKTHAETVQMRRHLYKTFG